ncbi:hypothetical protein BX600DRAFT_445489, partial [Xylariales sp. PMI_506]
MLRFVNCSYLSSPGRPPTLEALKKHAQSLAILIQSLAPSQGAGEVNNQMINRARCTAGGDDSKQMNGLTGVGTARSFVEGEAFDWLNDLSKPYNSDEAEHHHPLNGLVNLVKGHSDTKGTEYYCPLHEPSVKVEDVHKVQARGAAEGHYQNERHKKPYARHMNLLMHANETLEILDHEFSATGGLLSILPTDSDADKEQLEDARQTLIGQWLLFTQQLVSRMHDLEIAYANSLDLLGGEAILPMQHISALGPDGRSGREIVFPQDRWILANAGEDVWNFIHQTLDKKEHLDELQFRKRQEQGVTGAALEPLSQSKPSRGLAFVDLVTRFYRLKGHGNTSGSIFVLPAYADRPGTTYTREIENRVTVMAVPTPVFPTRVSEWEKRNEGKLRQLDEMKTHKADNTREMIKLRGQNQTLLDEVASLNTLVQQYRNATTPSLEAAVEDIARLQKQLDESRSREAAAQARVEAIEALLPNENSWCELSGRLPRDQDGNITDHALKSMLDIMKSLADENAALKRHNN